jgi:hypothetical protein
MVFINYKEFSTKTTAVMKACNYLKIDFIEPCKDTLGREYFVDLDFGGKISKDNVLWLLEDAVINFDDLEDMKLTSEEYKYLDKEIDKRLAMYDNNPNWFARVL